jgi:UDP-glucose 4-epimerase
MFEDMLLAAIEEGKIKGGILRYFNAAGRNVEEGLYEEHEPETHLIPLLVRGDTIDIYGNDYKTTDGTPLRDYIHVIDICEAHIKAYEYLQENNSLVCNIGTGQAHSVIEVVEKVNTILGKDVKMKFKSRRTGDAVALVSDVTKMKNVLQFQPKYDIVSIVKSMKD